LAQVRVAAPAPHGAEANNAMQQSALRKIGAKRLGMGRGMRSVAMLRRNGAG